VSSEYARVRCFAHPIVQERKFVDDRVAAVIALKRAVCDTPDKHFVVVNQKGMFSATDILH